MGFKKNPKKSDKPPTTAPAPGPKYIPAIITGSWPKPIRITSTPPMGIRILAKRVKIMLKVVKIPK